MASVYILVHRSGARFKIGKALNVASRIKAFGLATLDLARSEVLSVRSNADAYNLERALHRTFRRWRIPAADIIAQGGAVDGASEWFRAECTERLNQFLTQNRDLFRFDRRPLQDSSELTAWLQCGENDQERITVVNLVGAGLDPLPEFEEDWLESADSEPAVTSRSQRREFSLVPEPLPIADLGKKLLAAERFVGRSLLGRLRSLCTTLVLLPQQEPQSGQMTRTLCGIFEADHRAELDALLVELESEFRPFHFIECLFSTSDWDLRQKHAGKPEARLTYASVVVVLRWPTLSHQGQGFVPDPAEVDSVEESLREVTRWELGIEGWDLPREMTVDEMADLQQKARTELSGQINFRM